jgi:hypothetical protein
LRVLEPVGQKRLLRALQAGTDHQPLYFSVPRRDGLLAQSSHAGPPANILHWQSHDLVRRHGPYVSDGIRVCWPALLSLRSLPEHAHSSPPTCSATSFSSSLGCSPRRLRSRSSSTAPQAPPLRQPPTAFRRMIAPDQETLQCDYHTHPDARATAVRPVWRHRARLPPSTELSVELMPRAQLYRPDHVLARLDVRGQRGNLLLAVPARPQRLSSAEAPATLRGWYCRRASLCAEMCTSVVAQQYTYTYCSEAMYRSALCPSPCVSDSEVCTGRPNTVRRESTMHERTQLPLPLPMRTRRSDQTRHSKTEIPSHISYLRPHKYPPRRVRSHAPPLTRRHPRPRRARPT